MENPRRVVRALAAAAASALLLVGCSSDDGSSSAAQPRSFGPTPETISLTEKPLHRPRLPDDTRARYEAALADARAAYRADPSEQTVIWVGRRLGYLGRYRDAMRTYADGLRSHPESYRLYRHRGHRAITLRQLDDAIADLTIAAELADGTEDAIEPDGLPNDRNIPTSSDHTNIYYHLGLAHYLRGENSQALAAFQRCLDLAREMNPDMQVAAAYWVCLSARRAGDQAAFDAALADISAGMDVIENTGYHDLCLLYRGDIGPGDVIGEDPTDTEIATTGYGLAMWHRWNGNLLAARDQEDAVLETGFWPAFGYIAVEADRARGPFGLGR